MYSWSENVWTDYDVCLISTDEKELVAFQGFSTLKNT